MQDSPTSFKYAALIAYRGAPFCGWQKQRGSAANGRPSIQETIEIALAKMTGEHMSVVGSGRTDAGVNSRGQVAHFRIRQVGDKRWDPSILRKGLNSNLVESIRIQSVQEVPMDFHAQRSATHKQYSYYFQQGPTALPHLDESAWWIRKPLDVQAMNRSAKILLGKHDFKPFQGAGALITQTVREILEIEVTATELQFPEGPPMARLDPGHAAPGLVRVRVVGTGFLKQMVRGIAGTLLEVGEGRRPVESMAEILEKQQRSLVGKTAQPRGLWLEKVWYPGLSW